VTQPEQVQSPWYRWPGEWRRDEKFWREVATRTMAAMLSVGLTSGIAYVALRLSDYFKTPDALVTVLGGIAYAVCGAVTGACAWAFVASFRHGDMREMRFAFGLGTALFGALASSFFWFR
jgi:hypothetical protein